jgi:integrase/recombinase XerD
MKRGSRDPQPPRAGALTDAKLSVTPSRRSRGRALRTGGAASALYLTRSPYTSGSAFRASINGTGGRLSYDAAHHSWNGYCTAAGVEIDIHQLRHAHATELINASISIEAVRRRLGHASTETTQLYTLLADEVADAENRAARRRCDRGPR